MKIAIVGSHGVGKTTLVKELINHYKFNYIPDVVKSAHEKKFVINEDTPPESQFWILSKQIELERNTQLAWISEKSLFDNIIYGGYSIKDDKVRDVIQAIVMKEAKYDKIFYLPIEFDIPDDGLRSLNKNFQRQIDQDYIEFLKKYNIRYKALRGSVESRLKEAIKEIGNP